MDGKFISYFRVSTERQGRSGLGLDAQKQAVETWLNGGRWHLVASYVEVESGKRSDRPELAKAIAACRKHKATLIVAKLDRLSRNLAFIATLMDSKVRFVCADNPTANELTLHILGAVAQHERKVIGERTKAALQAAKERGKQLGRYGAQVLAPANQAAAADRAQELEPVIAEMQERGLSVRAMASELNEKGIQTPGAGKWHPTSVVRVLRRLEAQG